MTSTKYDLPPLDYKTRFSLWQVKICAVLAQSQDLDEVLKGFGKKKRMSGLLRKSGEIVRPYP